jgi:lipopolysaccharide export system protein LptA
MEKTGASYMKKIFISIFLYFPILLNSDIVNITADHFHADDITKVAYFEGNAHIKQGKNLFNSYKIIVHFNKKKKATKYEALGDVRFDITENGIHYTGSAGKITYSPNNSKYYFSGDVILKDLTNNRKISAQTISLDLKTGLADIKGAKKKPVHFIFEIEDRE